MNMIEKIYNLLVILISAGVLVAGQPQTVDTLNLKESNSVKIPFSNGISGAYYDSHSRKYIDFYPHLYAQGSENHRSEPVIRSVTPIITHNGRQIPVTQLQDKQIEYIPGTGIVRHSLQDSSFGLTQYSFCPFYVNHPLWVIYIVLESENINEYALNIKIEDKSLRANVGKWSYVNDNKRWLYVVISASEDGQKGNFHTVNNFKNQHTGFSALLTEIDWWESWHEQSVHPRVFEKVKKQFYFQTLTHIKMAQCREQGPAQGQIFSSLNPGSSWTYLADQTYATEALLKSGHIQEARQSLQFLLDNNKCGHFQNYEWFGKNYGIGQNYLLSVSKYYGKGGEATDSAQNGPNIELAGFGLVLANIEDYVKTTQDIQFLEFYWEKIRYQIADVLIYSIDQTGLIRKESGPWRIYLPGKHFTYTSVSAYRGLLAANWMATKMGDESYAVECKLAAQKLRTNIEEKLFLEDKNVLKGNLEGRIPIEYSDGSVIEAINILFSPQDKISKAALNTVNDNLKFNDAPPAYSNLMGNNQIHDNLFINLRLALALQKIRKTDQAQTIMNKIIKRAEKQGFLLPRYYNQRSNGGRAMIGRGASNIILYYIEQSSE